MEKVVLTREQERTVMNAMYDFVIRTTTNSKEATPAELGALPEMTKMLINYWAVFDFGVADD